MAIGLTAAALAAGAAATTAGAAAAKPRAQKATHRLLDFGDLSADEPWAQLGGAEQATPQQIAAAQAQLARTPLPSLESVAERIAQEQMQRHHDSYQRYLAGEMGPEFIEPQPDYAAILADVQARPEAYHAERHAIQRQQFAAQNPELARIIETGETGRSVAEGRADDMDVMGNSLGAVANDMRGRAEELYDYADPLMRRADAFYDDAQLYSSMGLTAAGRRPEELDTSTADMYLSRGGDALDQLSAHNQDLRAQYTGQSDPSAAMAQLQAGKDAAIQQQLAMARSAPGTNPLAMYQAQQNAAKLTQQAANQATQLRAQERQALRGELAQGAQAEIGSARTLAAEGLGIDRAAADTRIASRSANDAAAASYAGAAGTLAGAGANAVSGAQNWTSAGAQQDKLALTANELQGSYYDRGSNLILQDHAAKERQIDREIADHARVQDGLSGVAARNTAANNAWRGQVGGAAVAAGGGLVGTATEAAFAPSDDEPIVSDERAKTERRRLESENEELRAMLAGLSDGSADALAFDAGLDAENDPYLGLTPDEALDRFAAEDARRERVRRAREAELHGDPVLQGFLGGDGGVYRSSSDATAAAYRDQMRPAATAMPPAAAAMSPRERAYRDMAARLEPYSYEYRRGAGPPGRQYGVMAQDLERTPAGRTLVDRGPGGVRTVDPGRAAMAGLAVSSAHEQRIRKLERELERERGRKRKDDYGFADPALEF